MSDVIGWLDETTSFAVPLTTGDDDDLDHLTCAVCDPDMTISLCGRDVTDLEYSDELPDLCVVYRDLEVCPRCGDRLSPWNEGDQPDA